MKIRTQIYIGFLAVLIMFSVVTAVNINLSRKINRDLHWLSQAEDIMKNSALMQKAIVDMETGLRGYLLSDNEEFMEPYYEAEVDYIKIKQKQEILLDKEFNRIKELKLIHKNFEYWRTMFALPLLKAKKLAIEFPENRKQYEDLFISTAKKGVGKDLTDEIRNQFDKFDKDSERIKTAKTLELIQASELADNISLALNIFALFVAFITAYLIARLIVKRIREMVNLSETISSGSFNVRVEEIKRDELSKLGSSLNIMASTLKENFHKIASVNKELHLSKLEVEKNAKSKDLFFANMNHEIRTPLNAIIGFSNQLKQTELSEIQQKYLNAIHTSGNNLIILVNDILDISKLNAGKIILEKIPFSLSEEVTKVINLFSLIADGKGIALDCHIDEMANDHLVSDPTRLNQILINLVGNAIKFTSEGYVKIDIKHLRDDNEYTWLEFSVLDTGIGIDGTEMEGIFDSFSQGGADTTRKYGGSGLGLTIVKNLLELFDSKIYVESKHGSGSVFSFQLRILKATENDKIIPDEELDEEPNQIITGIKVLLVEDNHFNRLLIESILERWEWIVDMAESGSEAKKLLNKYDYDIVFLDIRLPDISGYEIIKFIRTDLPDEKSTVPVIAMTAHSLRNEEEKCLKMGMNGFVSKPFDEKILYKKVINLILGSDMEINQQHIRTKPLKVKDENKQPVDLTYLKSISHNDKSYILKMIDLFIEQTQTKCNNMNNYCNNHDWDRIKAEAHALKTSYMMMGMKKAAELLNTLEDFSYTEHSIPYVEKMVQSLLKFSEDAVEFLEKEKINLTQNNLNHENKK